MLSLLERRKHVLAAHRVEIPAKCTVAKRLSDLDETPLPRRKAIRAMGGYGKIQFSTDSAAAAGSVKL